MIPVDAQEAAEKMPDLLTAVAHGELVVFFRDGHAVAELHAPRTEYDPEQDAAETPEPESKGEVNWAEWFEQHPPIKLTKPETAEETQAFYNSMKRDF